MTDRSGSDIAQNADEIEMLQEILEAGDDLERSVSIFRRDRLMGEASLRVPECVNRPRFVTCTNWKHRFAGTDSDLKVRWAFDRRLWSVVVLHRRRVSGGWMNACPDEVLEVSESLAFANVEAIYDLNGWGCVEAVALPPWAAAKADS